MGELDYLFNNFYNRQLSFKRSECGLDKFANKHLINILDFIRNSPFTWPAHGSLFSLNQPLFVEDKNRTWNVGRTRFLSHKRFASIVSKKFISYLTEHSGSKKKNNVLPLYGNDSMNLNPLILTNIQGSVYFKGKFFEVLTSRTGPITNPFFPFSFRCLFHHLGTWICRYEAITANKQYLQIILREKLLHHSMAQSPAIQSSRIKFLY